MIADVLTLWDFLEKRYDQYTVIHALFSWDFKRLNGDENIEVEKIVHPTDPAIWYYRVKPYKNYIFVPFPVNPAVNVDYGSVEGTNPDSNIFRYVSSPMAYFASGGEKNLKVNFIVFGYEAENLIERVKAKG